MNTISLPFEVKRGRLMFYFLPQLGFYPRLLLFAVLALAGVSLMFRVNVILGAPVFLFGLALLVAKGSRNAAAGRKSWLRLVAADQEGPERWVIGAAKDLRKIRRKIEQGEGLPYNPLNGMTFTGTVAALAFAVAMFVMDMFVLPSALFAENMGKIVFIQVAVGVTLFFTTTAIPWAPNHISRKIDLLERERDRIMRRWSASKAVVSPMLNIDEKSEGAATPVDVKLLVRFDGAPEDFIGIQIQITFNMNQPYLYCVIIAKRDFAPITRCVPGPVENIVHENGKDSKVRYIVVRQFTTKNSGYATSEAQADVIVDNAMAISLGLLKDAARA